MPHVLSWDRFIERKEHPQTLHGALRAQRSQWLSQINLCTEESTMSKSHRQPWYEICQAPTLQQASQLAVVSWQVRINSDAPTTDTRALIQGIRVIRKEKKKSDSLFLPVWTTPEKEGNGGCHIASRKHMSPCRLLPTLFKKNLRIWNFRTL